MVNTPWVSGTSTKRLSPWGNDAMEAGGKREKRLSYRTNETRNEFSSEFPGSARRSNPNSAASRLWCVRNEDSKARLLWGWMKAGELCKLHQQKDDGKYICSHVSKMTGGWIPLDNEQDLCPTCHTVRVARESNSVFCCDWGKTPEAELEVY